MRAYVSEVANSGNLQTAVIPSVIDKEVPSFAVRGKAKALLVGNLRTNVLEELLADLHCIDVSGLMVGPHGDNEEVVG